MAIYEYIAQQLTIYGGCFLLIFGMLGNSITIFIFSSERSYRITPSTFYFLIATIYDSLQLLFNLLSRIVSVGFKTDLTRSSVLWCKARLSLAAVFVTMT